MPGAALWQLFDLPEGKEEEYTAWLDQTVIPAIKQSSGSSRAVRYKATDDKSPTHSVFYEAPSASSIQLAAQVLTKAEDQSKLKGLANLTERVFTHLSDSGGVEPPQYMATALIRPAEGTVEEFHAWYNEDHLEHVKHIDGWQRSQRSELTQSNKPDDAGTFLAFYEFFKEPDMQSETVKRNMGNARSVKNLSAAQSIEIRVMKAIQAL